MQVSSSSMFGSIFSTSQTAKTKPAAGVDMSWADTAPADRTVSAARSEFNDYQKMTPAEKMRAAMLAQMGVTEEDYKAMSDEDKKAIDDKIKEKIKEMVEGNGQKDQPKTGLIADVKV